MGPAIDVPARELTNWPSALPVKLSAVVLNISPNDSAEVLADPAGALRARVEAGRQSAAC